jgi:plastocyanin
LRPSQRPILLGLLLTLALAPTGAGAQSVLERTPNLAGGWVGTAGTAYFNFLHRFEHGDAPARKVINYPTFLTAYTVGPVLLGVNYASNSDLVASYPNEWEPFARLGLPVGPVRLAFTGAYNNAAESVDGEASLRVGAGPLALHGAARAFSKGFGEDESRFALGGGAVLSLHPNVAVAGDVVTLLDRDDDVGEEMAWGAALQLRIPATPHTLSLQASNTNTGTLQGSSRGGDVTRYGFEFTIPLTLSRFFGGGGGGAATATGQQEVVVTITDTGFTPARLTISPGTTVTWVNQGQLAHTATAENGSFDSGMLQPGARWSRRFDQVGETAYICTPHPFMRGAIVVTGGAR